MLLTKVNILKPAYFHVFEKLDKTIFEVETTEADYKQLATPKHIDPIYPKAKWLCSYAFYKFNTASGKLEHGQYFDEFGKQYLICWNDIVDRFGKEDLSKVSTLVVEDKFAITDPVLTPQCKDVTWL